LSTCLNLVGNVNTFFEAVELASSFTTVLHVLLVAVWFAALVFSIQVNRARRRVVSPEIPLWAGWSHALTDPEKS